MNAATITVLLADDHSVVRAGYRRLLELTQNIRVVAEADTAEACYLLYLEHQPKVTVIDLSMPGMGGLEGMRRILSRDAKARVLVFSVHENTLLAERAIEMGAKGYITKTSSQDVLIRAIEELAKGGMFLSPDIAQALALKKIKGETSPFESLSPREFEIFRLTAAGRSNNEIADTLHLTAKTVSNYLGRIKQKLGIVTNTEMVHLAIRAGLITP